MKSRELRLKRRPPGMPSQADFELASVELSEPGSGQVLVRNLAMSVDPYMRGRMRDVKSYAPPWQLGEVMQGGAVGRVVASKNDDFAVGDLVESNNGWREAFLSDGKGLGRIENPQAPPSAYLGVLGMPGRTAYEGLLGAAAMKDGETVFVSGAAGAVGSVAGQIAKLRGCTVIGSAGTKEKVEWCRSIGFDVAFDYHAGDLPGQLRRAAPNGLDVYFDNVGGDHLQAAIGHMRPRGRIALCGAIAQYNATEPVPGPNNLTMAIGLGLTLRGFIVGMYPELRDDFTREMGEWVRTGKVVYRETVFQGIEHAAEAFIGLFTGANTGKMVVKLAD
jgi:NADPH-dependent curcumin reductase CurA